MNEQMIIRLIDVGLAIGELSVRMRRGLDILVKAQQEGRHITKAELDTVRADYQVRSNELDAAISKAEGG